MLILNQHARRGKVHEFKERILSKLAEGQARKYVAVYKVKGQQKNSICKTNNLKESQIIEFVRKINNINPKEQSKRKIKLAWVSPLPPTETYVANYSKSLIPFLRKYFDLTVVTDTPNKLDNTERSIDWLLDNGGQFNEICYHIGNSSKYQSIHDCAVRWPGTVVLHDLYLGDLQYTYKNIEKSPNKSENHNWLSALYQCHGYFPIHQLSFEERKLNSILQNYSVNRELINRSNKVIVHSHYAQRILDKTGTCSGILSLPMVSAPRKFHDRHKARLKLGLKSDSILICCKGQVATAKDSIEIVEALSQLPNEICLRFKLIFIESNLSIEHEKQLLQKISNFKKKNKIEIKKYSSVEDYNNYLACDFAIHLGRIDQGENLVSATELICSGIPLITNGMGITQEIPADSSWIFSEYCTTTELRLAIKRMVDNKDEIRNTLREDRYNILSRFSPESVAKQYQIALDKKQYINAPPDTLR